MSKLTPEEQRKVNQVTQKLSPSAEWMRAFAESIDMGYEELMNAVESALVTGESIYVGDKETDVPDDFWLHYEAIIAEHVPQEKKDQLYFSCAC